MLKIYTQTAQRRGSSPVTNILDPRVDVWGERRLRSIKETPEDSFAGTRVSQQPNQKT